VQLKIHTIHQTQRAELFFGDITGQTAPYLFTELFCAFLNKLAVEIVVTIHGVSPYTA